MRGRQGEMDKQKVLFMRECLLVSQLLLIAFDLEVLGAIGGAAVQRIQADQPAAAPAASARARAAAQNVNATG